MAQYGYDHRETMRLPEPPLLALVPPAAPSRLRLTDALLWADGCLLIVSLPRAVDECIAGLERWTGKWCA